MASKVKLSKDTIEIDLSGVQASDRRRKTRIPEGIYVAKVVSATGKKFGTGSQGVEWVFEITDAGKGKGARFWYNNVLKDSDGNTMENSLWSFRGVLQALSPAIKIPDRMMKVPLDRLPGRTVALEIADGEDNNGKLRSEIVDVFNESLIEDDDEADDDEDFDEEEADDDLDSPDADEDGDDDDDEFDLDEDEL